MSKTKEGPSVTRGVRNNNPGNIRYNKSNRWLGLVGQDGKHFCKFSSLEYGFRALVILIARYIDRGFDYPVKIIYRYAPTIENNSQAYLVFVCKRAGLDPATRIEKFSPAFYDLISAIVYFESKIDITGVMIKNIYDSF